MSPWDLRTERHVGSGFRLESLCGVRLNGLGLGSTASEAATAITGGSSNLGPRSTNRVPLAWNPRKGIYDFDKPPLSVLILSHTTTTILPGRLATATDPIVHSC